jgi:hypothetical protein
MESRRPLGGRPDRSDPGIFIGSAESGRAGKGAIMIRIGTDLITLIVVDVVLAFAAAWMPWFPGDLQIARAIQHFGPSG